MQGFSFTAAQDPELQAIERRRRMAEMLRMQSQQPLQAQGNAPISPLSGAAKMLRAYGGARMDKQADEQEQTYAANYQKALASGLQGGGSMGDMATRLEQSGNPRAMELAAQLRMQEAARQAELQDRQAVLTPEQEAQKIRLAQAAKQPRLLTPEEEAQKLRIAQAGRAPIMQEFGVTPQLIQKPDGWYERIYSKSGGVTERKLEGEPVRGMQFDPNVAAGLAQAKTAGAEAGTVKAELESREASLPRLEQVADELSELGKKATYTMAGQGYNSVRRQFGMEPTEGALARAEYIAKVDNEILPLLRETFGAQFTQKEGESLKVTLGDPDKSPEEKDAVLRSFIKTKREQVKTLQRRTGTATASAAGLSDTEQQELEQLRKELSQ